MSACGTTCSDVGASPNVDMWILNWEHMLGQWQFIAQYGHWGKIKDLTVDPGNTDDAAYTVAAKSFRSKRTGVYLSFNQIKNKDNAWYDFSNGGSSSINSTSVGNRGADPRIIAPGVMHNLQAARFGK